MVAAALRWKLAIELIGIFVAVQLLGAGIGCAAALSIVILFALHATLMLLTFAIARPRAPLGTKPPNAPPISRFSPSSNPSTACS